MGFFANLFGKKEPELLRAKVMSTRAILNAHIASEVNTGKVMSILFFASSQENIVRLTSENQGENIIHADQLSNANTQSRIRTFASNAGNTVVLGERFPLSQQEQQLATQLQQLGVSMPVLAYAALDDAFFLQFGGERISNLMKSMGMGDQEFTEHPMIQSAIKNAQNKIAQKVSISSRTKSPGEWSRMHVKE
ncbi:MAG: hypothetical protein LW750_02930 [Bacteroidetes bacterium]|jgi:hypothetical protein|nr:hypothetical protein [Bacteroidota bacterium]